MKRRASEPSIKDQLLNDPDPEVRAIAEKWFREKPKPPFYERPEFWTGVVRTILVLMFILLVLDGLTGGSPNPRY